MICTHILISDQRPITHIMGYDTHAACSIQPKYTHAHACMYTHSPRPHILVRAVVYAPPEAHEEQRDVQREVLVDELDRQQRHQRVD